MTTGFAIPHRFGFLLAAGAGLSACSDLSINERVFRRGPEGWETSSVVCFPLEHGGDLWTGGGNATYSMSSMVRDGVVYVEAKSGDLPTVARRYDREFARSGKVDEFTFTTISGEQFFFRYWGSDPCVEGDLGTPP